VLITCPRCCRSLDDIGFRDIFDSQTGSLERFISCYYCGYEEFDEFYGNGYSAFPPDSCCSALKCAMFTPVMEKDGRDEEEECVEVCD